MAYQMIEDYSCIWRDGVTPLSPEGFAIHWWGDGSPQFFPIVELLVNRAAQASASVHFVGEAGRVACLTPINEVAWAQGDGGNGWGNRHLVSIECNPRCTAEDRETIAELIADQHIENGIPIILHPHKDFTSTACPGVWEQWIPWLTERALQIVEEKTKGVPLATTSKDDKVIVLAKQEGDTSGKIWAGDGVIRRHIPNPQSFNDLVYLGKQGFLSVGNEGQVITVKDLNAIGKDIAEIPTDTLAAPVPWYGYNGEVPKSGRNTTSLRLQAGWADTQTVGIANDIKSIGEVSLSPEDLTVIVTSLKEALAPSLAVELAKRLAE